MKTTVILDEDTAALLTQLSAASGLTVSEIIKRPLIACLADFSELAGFLDAYPIGTALHDAAINLLLSFGPESITAGIKCIAPGYVTQQEQFARSIG